MILPKDLLGSILEHAKREAPYECCGAILGRGQEAEEVVPARNASDTPEYSYEIAPEELLHMLEYAERRSLEVIGFYHSHPHGAPSPSGIDLNRAAWDGGIYLIVNLRGKARAWRWNAGEEKFEPEPLEVECR